VSGDVHTNDRRPILGAQIRLADAADLIGLKVHFGDAAVEHRPWRGNDFRLERHPV
jgi:hypothetical protein